MVISTFCLNTFFLGQYLVFRSLNMFEHVWRGIFCRNIYLTYIIVWSQFGHFSGFHERTTYFECCVFLFQISEGLHFYVRLKTGKNNKSHSEWICKQSSIDLIKKSNFLSSNLVFSGCFHGANEATSFGIISIAVRWNFKKHIRFMFKI